VASPHTELKYSEQINQTVPLPTEMIASMARRRTSHHRRIRERVAAQQLLMLTEEEREIRNRLRPRASALAGSEEQVDRLKRERSIRFEQAKKLFRDLRQPTAKTLPLLPPRQFDDPNTGALWWAATSVTWSTPMLFADFKDDGLHFGGEIIVSQSDLWFGSLHVFVQFGLGPDRMPSGTNFISNPFVNLVGAVDGSTLASFFDFGGQWSKCWLNTSQLVGVPAVIDGAPADLILGINTQSSPLIFIESIMDIEASIFPGFMGLPPVPFQLTDNARNNGIEVDLQIDFDLQMEGDFSTLRFDNGSTLGGDALLQTFQWNLEAL
jgi:hypothetical protein